MFSLKKISLALLIVFAGLSKASYLKPNDNNYVSTNNWLRLECGDTTSDHKIDCSLYFDYKKHSLSDDPAECYVYGVVKNSDPTCMLYMPEHPCTHGNSQPWIAKCLDVYYSGSVDVKNNTGKALKDNVKIGSFSNQAENFMNVAFFTHPSFGYEQPLHI